MWDLGISSLLKLGWLSADFSRRADDAVPTALRWWTLPRWMSSAGRFYSFYFDKNRIATSCWVHEERWRRWMIPVDDCACESRWRNIDDVGRSCQEETYKVSRSILRFTCVEMADVFSFFLFFLCCLLLPLIPLSLPLALIPWFENFPWLFLFFFKINCTMIYILNSLFPLFWRSGGRFVRFVFAFEFYSRFRLCVLELS